MMNEARIIDVLKTCYDPEIPIDLWNLGLIYDINTQPAADHNKVDVAITMSLTTPGCTMKQTIANDVKSKLKTLDDINHVAVNITFDPPWDPSRLTPEARQKLGLNSTSEQQKEDDNHAWE